MIGKSTSLPIQFESASNGIMLTLYDDLKRRTNHTDETFFHLFDAETWQKKGFLGGTISDVCTGEDFRFYVAKHPTSYSAEAGSRADFEAIGMHEWLDLVDARMTKENWSPNGR
jgi:hypothetical protein